MSEQPALYKEDASSKEMRDFLKRASLLNFFIKYQINNTNYNQASLYERSLCLDVPHFITASSSIT